MQLLLIFIPLLAFILLVVGLVYQTGKQTWFFHIITAHVLIFLYVLLTTEILSIFNRITFHHILIIWLILLSACLVIVFTGIKKAKVKKLLVPDVFVNYPKITMVIVFILLITLFTGIVYPPNNWDSMTYHMSRIVHWIDNQNVAFYPTAITRQNYQMPLAEFAIMHLQVLTDSDTFANIIQWESFCILILLGYLIADELGMSTKQKAITSLVVATLPMGILQASSTQNDLVVSSFVMAFALFMLRVWKSINRKDVLLSAIALGLALFTKGTAYLFCAGIGTFLGIGILVKNRLHKVEFIKTIGNLFLIVFIGLLLNTGHFIRNFEVYGNPLSTEGSIYQNVELSIKIVFANIIRNGALHLGMPSKIVNQEIYMLIEKVLGTELNNPKTTWGQSFEIPYSLHEDTAGNLIHILILIFGLLPILFAKKFKPLTQWYGLGITASVIIFCAFLKWQPWASRLHTPMFMLASPFIALVVAPERKQDRKWLANLLPSALILYSMFFLFLNQSRPIVYYDWVYKDREEHYFQNRKNLYQEYLDAYQIVEKARNGTVGLYFTEDSWEYPLWVFAKNRGDDVSFQHVGVENESSGFSFNQVLPQFVLSTKNLSEWESAFLYELVYESEYINVYQSFE